MNQMFVIVAIGGLVGWTISPGADPRDDEPSTYYAVSLAASPFNPDAATGCGQCQFCSLQEDKVEVSRGEFNWMGITACEEGTFCDPNDFPPECSPTEEDDHLQLTMADLERIWNVATQGSGFDVAELLHAYPDNVWVNLERRSVQAQSCGDYPLLNVPLTDEQVSALQQLDLI